MASPADFAQVTRLQHVTSIRTSGDHGYLVGPEVLWAWFLHVNVMARALGLWPYKDVFHSTPTSATREVEALIAALSAGPVGVGDRIGEADVELIRRTCRADGVLVRPDVPVAATDRASFDAPVWSDAVLVGSAHTQHAAGRWAYVVACNPGMEQQRASGRVELTELGDDHPGTDRVAVFDWRTGAIEVTRADTGYDLALDPAGWDYRVVAPVLAGGLAVIGDPAVYATAGDTRIAGVEAEPDAVRVTVLGAGERVRVVVWAERPIAATAWSPAGGSSDLAVTRDDRTGAWETAVEIGAAGWSTLRFRPI